MSRATNDAIFPDRRSVMASGAASQKHRAGSEYECDGFFHGMVCNTELWIWLPTTQKAESLQLMTRNGKRANSGWLRRLARRRHLCLLNKRTTVIVSFGDLDAADIETNFQPCWLKRVTVSPAASGYVVVDLYSQAPAEECDVEQPDASMAALHRTIISAVFIWK